MKIVNDDDTLFSGTFQFDGYEFGGRLLEGVIFHADTMNGVVDFDTVRVAPDSANYFEDLNQEKWLNEAREFIKETDGFTTRDGKADVWVKNDDQPTVQPQPVKIEAISGMDILARFGKK